MISNLVTHLHLPAFFALKRIVCLLIAIAYYTVAERKIMAAIQRRRGPNVVGPGGLLQPIADGLKLVAKEMIIPGHANSHIFVVAPIAILTISLTGGTVLPFAYLATEHTFGNIPYNGSAELTARLGNRAFEEFPGTPDSHCNHGVFVPGEFLLDPEFQFEDGSIFSGATIDGRWKIFVGDLQETFELQYIYIQDNRDIVMSLGAGIPDVGMGWQRRAYYYAEKVCIAIFFWQAGKGPLLFYSMTRPRFAIFPNEISYKYCIAMAKTTMRTPLIVVCGGAIFMLAWCGAELQIHTFMAHAFYYGQLRLELQLVFNYYTPGMIQHLDQMLDGNTLPPTYFADRAFPGLLKVAPVTLLVFLIFLPFFVYYLFYHTDTFDARIRKFNRYPPKRTGMVSPVLVIPPEYYKQEVVGEYKASRPPVKIERPPTEEEKEAFYAQLEIESAEHLGKLHAELARIKTIFTKTDYRKRNGLPGVWMAIRKPKQSKLAAGSMAVIPPLKELNIINLIIAGLVVLTLLFVSTIPLQFEMLGTTYARFVGYIWWSAVGIAMTAHYVRDYPNERRKDFFMIGAGLLMVMGYRFFNSGDAAFGVPGMQQGGEIFVRYPNQRVMGAEYFDQYLSMEYLHIFLHAGDFPREGKGIRHDPSIIYIFFDNPDIPYVYLESPLHTACIPKHDLYPFSYR